MHDEVFCLLRHADWQFEDAALDVVEELVPVEKGESHTHGNTYFDSEK